MQINLLQVEALVNTFYYWHFIISSMYVLYVYSIYTSFFEIHTVLVLLAQFMG